VTQVEFHRVDRDIQASGDFRVRQTAGDHLEDLAFARS
jgi:hypothetical protein